MTILERAESAPNFQSLSAFRILLAIYLLVQFAFVLPFYGAFYGPGGIMPLSALAQDSGVAGLAEMVSALRVADAIGFGAVLPVLYPASLLCLLIGWRTRWANGVALVCAGYLFWRNPYLVSGAEILARLLLLWSLFVPLNRYWSVDAALDRPPRRRSWPALPFLALRLQIASLYFFSGLFKLEGVPWRQGFALDWALRDDLYAGTPLGIWLAASVPLLVSAVGYAVIVFQLSFPYLIYSPWRNDLTRALAISGSAALHLSFIVFLRIGGFPYICLIMLVLLVPDSWFDRMLRARRERLRAMTIYFEPGCGFCEKVARLFREFALSPTVAVKPSSSNRAAHALLKRHNSWVVMGLDGKPRLKWRAVATVLAQNQLTAWLGAATDWSPLRPAFARFYDCIGAHRRALGKLTARLLPFRSDRPPCRALLALNAALAALGLACNLVSLDQWTAETTRQEIHAAAQTGWRKTADEFFGVLQIRQSWALFSPVPVHSTWDFRFYALDRAGQRTEIGPALPFRARRADGQMRFSRLAWVQYFSRFDLVTDADWAALGSYLCRAAGRPASIEVALRRQPIATPHPGGSAAAAERRFSCARISL